MLSSCLSTSVNIGYKSQLINSNHELNADYDLRNGLDEANKSYNVENFYDSTTGLINTQIAASISDLTSSTGNRIVSNRPVPVSSISIDVPIIKPTVYTSTQTATVTKSDCSVGYIGSSTTLTATSTSTISQVDANNKAIALLGLQKAQYQSTIGTCGCNLVWREPIVSYANDQATITFVILGATEYSIGSGSFSGDNQFIVDLNGTYKLTARNADCIISGEVNVLINTDYGISNIQVTDIVCEIDTPGQGTITNIQVTDSGCEVKAPDNISNIQVIQTGCDINDMATIENIQVINDCN